MQQTTEFLLCPHCVNSDHPLESNGVSWLKCPLCGLNFRSGEIKGRAITKGYLPGYLQKMLDINKDVDNQMNNIVEESIDNLMHEIIMTKIFAKKAKKVEETAIKTELDKLFDVIFA